MENYILSFDLIGLPGDDITIDGSLKDAMKLFDEYKSWDKCEFCALYLNKPSEYCNLTKIASYTKRYE